MVALIVAGALETVRSAHVARHDLLLEVGGVPMLLRVIRTLRASPDIGPLAVSIDDEGALGDLPELGEVILHRSLASPSKSVGEFLESRTGDEPVLVVTAWGDGL